MAGKEKFEKAEGIYKAINTAIKSKKAEDMIRLIKLTYSANKKDAFIIREDLLNQFDSELIRLLQRFITDGEVRKEAAKLAELIIACAPNHTEEELYGIQREPDSFRISYLLERLLLLLKEDKMLVEKIVRFTRNRGNFKSFLLLHTFFERNKKSFNNAEHYIKMLFEENRKAESENWKEKIKSLEGKLK